MWIAKVIALATQGLFWFHTNVIIICSSSVRTVGIWVVNALNLKIVLGSVDILTILAFLKIPVLSSSHTHCSCLASFPALTLLDLECSTVSF